MKAHLLISVMILSLVTACNSDEDIHQPDPSATAPHIIPATQANTIPPPTMTVTSFPTNTPLPLTITETTTPTSSTAIPGIPLDGRGGGVIAFTSSLSGNMDIYLMNADGSGVQQLTTHNRDDYWPTWSQDGNRIAFASEREGNFDIYILDLSSGLENLGSDDTPLNVQSLTNSSASDLEPSWSPDGSRIAFMSDRDGNWEVYVIDVVGDQSGEHTISRLTDNPAYDGLPAWSPDGTQIVFVSDRDGDEELYLMNLERFSTGDDGEGLQRLTYHNGVDSYPSWSPDGSRITFASTRSGRRELHIVEISSGEITQITHDGASVWMSAWSSDGEMIAFTSNRDGNREIYLFDDEYAIDGLGEVQPTRLTENRVLDGTPAWRP